MCFFPITEPPIIIYSGEPPQHLRVQFCECVTLRYRSQVCFLFFFLLKLYGWSEWVGNIVHNRHH